METFDRQIEQRSRRAILCLPFNSYFYKFIQTIGISAKQVYIHQDKYISCKATYYKSKDQIERIFCWLISIGILRREVDGQGLTAKVRITPLGKKILSQYPELPSQKANHLEQLRTWLLRKTRI